jgi:hypothetical protein
LPGVSLLFLLKEFELLNLPLPFGFPTICIPLGESWIHALKDLGFQLSIITILW